MQTFFAVRATGPHHFALELRGSSAIQVSNQRRKRGVESAIAPESFSDIAANGIGRVIELRAQLQIIAQGTLFREREDFGAQFVPELPDDQFFEVPCGTHRRVKSTRCAVGLSTTYQRSTQNLPRAAAGGHRSFCTLRLSIAPTGAACLHRPGAACLTDPAKRACTDRVSLLAPTRIHLASAVE